MFRPYLKRPWKNTLYLQITLIACFSSFDGTSLRQCREYNSDYAWVTFYANIAGAIGPFVASLTIKDAPEGSGGNLIKYDWRPGDQGDSSL